MIYLDYQATTPLASEAREAMLAWLDNEHFGNPHSPHRMGRAAKVAVELAREQVAALLPPGGRVVFTGNACEAVNLAMRGVPGDGSANAATNTTIAVVATDAPLEDLEAERMAVIANDGLARAIKPIHGIGDGDTIFGLSTTPPSHTLTNAELGAVFNAAADALGRAVVMAVIKSHQLGNSRVGYCEQYASACRGQKVTK